MTLKPKLHGGDFTDYFDTETYGRFMEVQVELEGLITSRSDNLDPLDQLMIRALGYMRKIMPILEITNTQELGRQHYEDLRRFRELIARELNKLIYSLRSYLPRDERTKLPYLESSCNFDDLLVPCRAYIKWRNGGIRGSQQITLERVIALIDDAAHRSQ